MDANLDTELEATINIKTPQDAEHLDGKIQGPFVMVEIGHGQATYCQVAVADGLHLLQAKFFG